MNPDDETPLEKAYRERQQRDSLARGIRPDATANQSPNEAAYEEYRRTHPTLAQSAGRFLANVAKAAPESFLNAVAAPGVGEARPDPRLSKGGNSAQAGKSSQEANAAFLSNLRKPYDAEHGAVTQKERAIATAQTVANVAAPALSKLRYVGVPLAGAATGAAYDPEHPVQGAAVGAALGTFLNVAPWVGGKALDVVGARPASYAGTPSLPVALADASEGVVPSLATRNVNIPPVESPAKRLLQSTARAVGVQSVEERALAMITRAMQRDGVSLERAVQLAATQSGMAPNTLMELAGRNTMRLGRSALTAPGRGSDLMAQRLSDRALTEEERFVGDLLSTSGSGQRMNIPATKAALHDEAQAAAAPLYEKLRGIAPQDMQGAAEFFDRPAFKAAYSHAEKVAANQGKKLPPLFEDVKDEAGKVVGKKLRPMDFETVDRVKRALDDVLYDAERLTPSELASQAGGLSNEGRSVIEKARGEFLDLAEPAFPGYKDARNAYAGPTALRRASERGEKVLSMTPDEIAEFKGTLGDSERQMFNRAGLETFIQRRIESTAPGSDVTRQVAKTVDKKRLAELFDNDTEKLAAFGQKAAEMAKRFRTRNFLGAQSATADKLAELAELSGFTLDDIADAAMGKPAGALRKAAERLKRVGTEKTGEAVARKLTAGATPESGTIEDVLAELLAFERKQDVRTVRRATRGAAAGIAPSQTTKSKP